MNGPATKLGVNGLRNFYYGKRECLIESGSTGILFLFLCAEILLSFSDNIKKQSQTTRRNLPVASSVAFEWEAMILRPEHFPEISACDHSGRK